MIEKKRILLFRKTLAHEGGAERLMLEIAKWFIKFGYEVRVVSVKGKNTVSLFDGAYADVPIASFHEGNYPTHIFWKIWISLSSVGRLRKEIKIFRPDILLGQNPADAELLYLASLGMRIPYATFLYASFFNFPEDGLKYMAPFNRVFTKVRNSISGHQAFIPLENPVRGFFARLALQCRAWMNYFVVRRAAYAFSMTRRMAWENEQFYSRPVIDIKSGVNPSFFNYKSKKDMRAKYGFPPDAKILVDISRLIPGKRIDLCIRTIAELKKKRNDIYFVVGGRGPEDKNLEALIKELRVESHAVLAGFVAEEDLLDLYASAAAIFHPAWIDFDLTVMEGLSLRKKVICSTDYDLSGDLGELKGKMLFEANPDPVSMARVIEHALNTESILVAEAERTLNKFTWEAYSQNIASYLFHTTRR
ncbi:MAG: glycosyltransferase family 4 protein [Patescibacteria group bacterium]